MLSRCLLLAPSHLTVARALMPAGEQVVGAGNGSFGPYGTGRAKSSSEPLVT